VELARQHVGQVPPALRALNPAVPEPLEDAVMRALAKPPAKRPTAAELERLLSDCVEAG
jgi:hypothetical protein